MTVFATQHGHAIVWNDASTGSPGNGRLGAMVFGGVGASACS